MKAEDFTVPETSYHLASMGAAKSMGRVEEQFQVPLPCNLGKFFDPTRTPPEMDPDNAGSPGGYHLFHTKRVDAMADRLYVAKYGRYFLPLQRMGRSHKREGRQDYFAGQTQSPNGDFKPHRAVAHSYTVSNAQEVRNTALELPDVRSLIGKPSSIQDVVDALQETSSIANIGTPHVEMILECRRTAQ
jgi:hypothetical protein